MGAAITFDELEVKTYSALAKTGQLRRKIRPSCLVWPLMQGARVLQVVANDVGNIDWESMPAGDREYLIEILERLHRTTNEFLSLSEKSGLTEKWWLQGSFKQIQESSEAIGDFLETHYLSCNEDFRGMVSETIAQIKRRKTDSSDWRSSLAKMQD